MIEIIPNWHPVFVKFTVGLLWTSALFYLGWVLWPRNPWREQWRVSARWMLWAGALAAVATVISGFIAYNTVPHDGQAHPVMTTHRNWGIAALVVILAVASLAAWLGPRGGERRWFLLPAALVFALVTVTGYYGAQLVYQHGLGVERLPDPDAHHHDHDHHHH
jgi:uncharacterized membrane protein